jgi:mRNA-degrading endonuclease YafQ of YafQ-DinJ toxin-antitoxin module
LARDLIILPRFKRDYRIARGHPEFDIETLEYVFDVMVSGGKLPDALREHRLDKRSVNWSGFTECHFRSGPPAHLQSPPRVGHSSPNRNSQEPVCSNNEGRSAENREKATKVTEAEVRLRSVLVNGLELFVTASCNTLRQLLLHLAFKPPDFPDTKLDAPWELFVLSHVRVLVFRRIPIHAKQRSYES